MKHLYLIILLLFNYQLVFAQKAASNSPVCIGSTVSLTASGGSSYSWTGPNGFSSNLQNPSIPNATALASGRYTVIIDQKSFTQEVVVGQRPQYPRYMFQEITGAKLSLISVPGLESDYITYAWTGPNGFSSNDKIPVFKGFNENVQGLYKVKITDDYGCIQKDSINIKLTNADCPYSLTALLQSSQTGTSKEIYIASSSPRDYTFCKNTFDKLTIDTTYWGSDVKVTWFKNQQQVSIGTPTIGIDTDGTYSAIVTKGTCRYVSSPINIKLTANTSVLITTSVNSNIICDKNGSITLNGSADGQTVDQNYVNWQWLRNDKPIDNTSRSSITVSDESTYKLVVRDAFCSGISEGFVVKKTNKIEANLSIRTSVLNKYDTREYLVCNDWSDYTYLWVEGAGAKQLFLDGKLIGSYSEWETLVSTDDKFGTFVLKVQNGACEAYDTLTITKGSKATAVPIRNSIMNFDICKNPNEATSYLYMKDYIGGDWSSIWYKDGQEFKTGYGTSMREPGVYQFIAKNSKTGCVAQSQLLTISPAKTPFVYKTFEKKNIKICTGNEYTLSSPECQSTYITQIWKKDGKTISPDTDNPCNLTVSEGGKYWVEWQLQDCTNYSDTVTVEITPTLAQPILSMSCNGTSWQLNAGSSTANTFLWYSKGVYLGATTSPNLPIGQGGNNSYQVVAYTQGSCPSISSFLNVKNILAVEKSMITACSGTPFTLSAQTNLKNIQWSGPNSFTSSNAQFQIPNPSLANSGVYTVKAWDTHIACALTADVSVYVSAVPTMTYVSTLEACEGFTFKFPNPLSLPENKNVSFPAETYELYGPNINQKGTLNTFDVTIPVYNKIYEGTYTLVGYSPYSSCPVKVTTQLKTVSTCKDLQIDQQTLNSLKPPCPNGTFDLPFTLIGDFPSNQQIVAKMEKNGAIITVGTGTSSPVKITIPQWFDIANVWVETSDGSVVSSRRTLTINSVDKNSVPQLLPSLESELISKTNFSGCDSLVLKIANISALALDKSNTQWFYNQTLTTTKDLNYTVKQNKGGQYAVQVAFASGCSLKSEEVNVSFQYIYPPINVYTYNNDNYLYCGRESMTIRASTYNNATYSWSRNDTLIATTKSPTLEINKEGVYKVSMSLGACRSNSETLQINTRKDKLIPVSTYLGDMAVAQPLACNSTNYVLYSSIIEPKSIVFSWLKNDVKIPNVNTENLPVTESGRYRLQVSSGDCFGLSNEVVINNPLVPPTIEFSITTLADDLNRYNSIQPDTISICSGSGINLSFSMFNNLTSEQEKNLVSGTQTWYKDNQVIYVHKYENNTNTTSSFSTNTFSTYSYDWGQAGLQEVGTYKVVVSTKFKDGSSCDFSSKNLTLVWAKDTVGLRFIHSGLSTALYPNVRELRACSNEIRPFEEYIKSTTGRVNVAKYTIQKNNVTVKTTTSLDTLNKFTISEKATYRLIVNYVTGCVAKTQPINYYPNSIKVELRSDYPFYITNDSLKICNTIDDSIESSIYVAASDQFSKNYQYVWYKDNSPIKNTDAHVKQVSEGIYQLKVSSGNCTGESKKIVVYKPKLSLPITPADSAYFCEGKTVELKLPEAKGLRYHWQMNQQEIENATTASLTVNKSGVYRSLVYDEKCWDMSPSVKIGQLPNIPATASISGDQSIDYGKEAKLKVDLGSHAPWTFKLSDGREFTAQKTPFEITVNPLSTTSYTLSEVKNICGTGTVSGTAKVTVLVLGIEEESGIHVEVYPVPASDYLTWKVRTDKPASYDLRLSDTQGRVLEVQHNTARSQAHEGQLNISILPAGVYFLQMTVGGKTFSRKVIKE